MSTHSVSSKHSSAGDSVPPIHPDDEWMGEWEAQVRMLLAEAGFPDARVYAESTGIFVEGVPDVVTEKAFAVLNARADQDVRP